jgi:hypothetical protein
MKTCTDHNSFIVVYEEDSCPVCRMERLLREAKYEADRMGRDNDRLCDKVFELEHGKQAVGR